MSNLATRYTGNYDEARQGLNFAFLKVLQNIHRYDPKYSLATWIRTIFVRHFIDEFRKKRQDTEWFAIENVEGKEIPITLNQVEETYESEYLDYLLNALPLSTRLAFTMYAVDGFGYSEIAEILETTENTCRWHINSARKKLKEMLNADLVKQKSKAI